MADVSIFLSKKDSLLFLIPILFVKSKQKKMNGLLKKRVFELVFILKVLKNIKIFNFYFMNKIKNLEIANTFEKSKLVIKTYNDYDKILILAQLFIIQ